MQYVWVILFVVVSCLVYQVVLVVLVVLNGGVMNNVFGMFWGDVDVDEGVVSVLMRIIIVYYLHEVVFMVVR